MTLLLLRVAAVVLLAVGLARPALTKLSRAPAGPGQPNGRGHYP